MNTIFTNPTWKGLKSSFEAA